MFVWLNGRWIYFEKDGGNGGGEGVTETQTNANANEANPENGQPNGYNPAGILPDDVVEGLRKLVTKQASGNPSEALELLYNDNKRLRDELRATKDKAVKDGQIAVPNDEWQAYQTLGKAAEIKASIDELGTLKNQMSRIEREALIGKVAGLAGYKPAVLQRIAGDLEYKITGVTNGKGVTEDRPFVVVDGKDIPLADYVKSNLADFLPALQEQSAHVPGLGRRPDPAGAATVGSRAREAGPAVSIRNVF